MSISGTMDLGTLKKENENLRYTNQSLKKKLIALDSQYKYHIE